MKKKTNLTIETALQHSLDFLKLLLSRFMSNNSLQNAAAMTYTTLLSLVPLIAVSIAVFSVFPIADQVSLAVQDFVFENFVPASSDVLQSYLDEFSGKAAKMTGTSFVFLVIVAVMLMASIDQAFNRIWRVKRKRGFMKQFMVYWSVLSLGPILIALSIAVTSYIISLPLLSDSGVLKPAGKLLVFAPVAVSAIAFMLMYSVIPNRPVPLKHALMGGFVAAILFELSKRGFGFYVTHFPTYEAIYGALATIPIFLVWLYLCWLVTLLGAEFTYCLSVYRYQKSDDNWQGDKLLDVLQILSRLWRAQQRGEALSLEQLTEELKTASEEQIENLLIRMQLSGLVLNTMKYEWALGRDLSHLTLAQLFDMRSLLLPTTDEINSYDGEAAASIRPLLGKVSESSAGIMQIPLDELFSGKP
ncbi:MAG: virulence factor BrkB family protein [Gammaproteobacteria bacterium]|nr:virulence factor BrkB family protein [Gammaproteobacteria bacterium]